MQGEAEGNRADALAASALGGECRGCARANEAVLVLRGTINHGANERIRGRVTVAFTAGAHEAGTRRRHGALDVPREHDVARDPIAPGHDKNG